MKLSVLVPVYNEENTVAEILEKLISLEYVHEIIVVNDCSKDNSLQEIEKVESDKIVIINHTVNQGKTAAIRTAKNNATGDIVIIQDADLEYDPEEIESVIQPIIDGKADVVYGSRFLVKKASRVLYFYHLLANKFLTFLCNLFTNLSMTDIETCYKAFKTPILKEMELTSKGFGMEVEITATIAKLPLKIYEVPISYYGRTYEEGKKIGLKDGLHAIYYIFYYNIFSVRSPMRKAYYSKIRKMMNLYD